MRLLLCEDEIEMNNAVCRILKHFNYSVDAVFDGEEALVCLQTENYDTVLLDIMMPKVDGITVLKKTREKGNLVPIIMLTAKSQTDDKVIGLDCGANDYITKPFDTKELLARIRAVTRVATNTNSSTLKVGNISLDRKNGELACENESFKLANKEYQMMEMLMINSGCVISTERFMEKIWGYESETEINVVWVYISYLRKKLNALNANIKIVAKRGIGYSLELQA